MILITGGLGFVGSHLTRAFLNAGESCLLVQRRAAVLPEHFADVADRVVVEQADITDRAALLDVGRRHRITGIAHLAGSMPWPVGAQPPVDGARSALDGLLNVVQAAGEWGVHRLGVASTIGVYGGVAADGPFREDLPLPMSSGHVIPAFKKIGELLTGHLADAAGLDIVQYRIGAAWGPLGHPDSRFFAAPQLVHAAVHGTTPDFGTAPVPPRAADGIDLVYAPDVARAIAGLHLADHLNHRTYNVAAGRITTNAEVLAAIRAVLPETSIELPDGRDPDRPADVCLDITRLRDDTGYRPAFDTEQAVADYVRWLRAGNPR